ncbi:MAG: nucleotidyl transferase AbiEii/AbiGii toxin family protein [Candidatus Sumerlaeia bacterium]|nr:nucleotidyl transferase AbiEii/AbiGii toxin family protein [Candidatus Sumerlaeia bacterium]
MNAAIVEKDWWVCWTLRELFRLPNWKDHFYFKGGTSLSKGWKFIHRFSEDIDIVISREKLGFPGDHSLGANQLKRLRQKCPKVVKEISEALGSVLKSSEFLSSIMVVEDRADLEGQTLLVEYQGQFKSTLSYLRPVVKIEFGARSDIWPSEVISFSPMLFEAFPNSEKSPPIEVRALSPSRTFWEKAMLLHEENFRPAERNRKSRLARHYYDLWCLLISGIGDKAVEQNGLFESVAQHRQTFFRQSFVDYSTLRKGSLKIVPNAEKMLEWQQDYSAMQSYLFPGVAHPTWEQIIERVRAFEQQFNSSTN